MRDMASLPYDARADLRAYGFAHSPCGLIPTDPAKVSQGGSTPSSGGWSDHPFVNPDAPAHPTPGVNLLDRQLGAEAAREQHEEVREDAQAAAMRILAKQAEMQTEIMRRLVSDLSTEQQKK
jgi:hypothetical protein